jgi:lysophospholipase L1-like esterase
VRAVPQRVFCRYVALGDSQTEGVGDDLHPDGVERGWADRFAELIAVANPHLLYANLAVRGRRIAEVHEQQLPPALALEPDLVSVIAGINDIIRPRFDLDAALTHMDEMQRDLSAGGTTVLTSTFPDLSSFMPAARLLRMRLARFNAGLRAIAASRGSLLLDFEQLPLAADPRLWCDDRLHLNPAGHRQVALAMAGALELTDSDHTWTGTLPQAPPDPLRGLQDELLWVRAFLLPWIGRRLTGRSSGDGRLPKRPQLRPLRTPILAPRVPGDEIPAPSCVDEAVRVDEATSRCWTQRGTP